MRKSCCSNGIAASKRTTTTSENFTARKPSETESFSSFSCTFAFFRIPAVSHNRMGTSSQSWLIEILSRVIPASGPVSILSWPNIWFTRVDLPAFGLPMIEICRGLSAE